MNLGVVSKQEAVFGCFWSGLVSWSQGTGHRERLGWPDGRVETGRGLVAFRRWSVQRGAWRCLGLERATGLWVKTHTIHTWAPWWTNEHEQIPLCVGREPRPRGPVEEVCWLAGLPVVGIFF